MDELIHIPAYVIDRCVAGLLGDEETASVETHARSCTACECRIDQARQARGAFLRANPPEIRVRQLLESGPRPSRLRWLAPAFAAPALAALLLVVQPWGPDQDGRSEILFKGGAVVTFEVHRPATEERWQGKSGEALRAGDAIQIRVTPDTPSHATVFSVDHLGAVTRLMAVEASRAMALPWSLTLDESTEPERLFVVVSKSTIKTEEFTESARGAFVAASERIEELEVVQVPGRNVEVESFLVRKEKPPSAGWSDVSSDR